MARFSWALLPLAAAQVPPLVLDGHVHITNISLIDYPWANADAGVCPCAPPCLCDWTVEDYANITAPSAVAPTRFVFVEVGANASDWLLEAQWVHSVATSGTPGGSMIAAIVAQQPPGFGSPTVSVPSMSSLLDALVAVGPLVHGIRAGAVEWTNPDWAATIAAHAALLPPRGLSLELTASLATPGLASALAALVANVTGLTLILDHAGGPPVLGNASTVAAWRDGVTAVAALPSVYIKVGGIVQGYKSTGVLPTLSQVRPWVVHVLESFTPRRAIFEGNWFFCDWGSVVPGGLDVYWLWSGYTLALLAEGGAGQADYASFFWGTGAEAYRVTQ